MRMTRNRRDGRGAAIIRSAWLALCIVAAGATPASALEFRAQLDRDTVPVGGQLTLRLIVSGPSGNLPRIRLPAIDGFDAYSAGTSQNMSIISGRVETSLTQSFVLVAKREGEFTLGPFELRHEGEALVTQALPVRVVSSAAAQGAPGQRPASRDRGPVDVFVRAEIDKREAYVNEQVTLTFRFYSRVRLANDPEYTPSSAVGFWVEDLPPVRQYYEEVDGVQYLVNEVKSALFPTTPGKVTIGPATIKVTRTVADNIRRRDPFQVFGGDPFGVFGETREEVLRTKPITLEVKRLPLAGAPSDFSGLVGDYRLEARVDKTVVKTNQPITVTFVLRGDGNVKTAPEPRFDLPPTVRAYDSSSRVTTSKEGYRLRGEKVVERILIPQAPGELVLPPASVTSFDPKAGAYRTVATQPIRVTVEPGDAVGMVALEGAEVRRLARDLNPIREGATVLAPARRWLPERPLFWIGQAIPIALFAVVLRAGRARRRLNSNVDLARAHRARGVATKRLKAARHALADPSGSDGFYALLGRSLTDYVSDKLAVSRHGISRDEMLATLASRGIDTELVERLRGILERCDMGRFAAAAGSGERPESLLASAEDLIVAFERTLRA